MEAANIALTNLTTDKIAALAAKDIVSGQDLSVVTFDNIIIIINSSCYRC
jgi:hypothetical protein